MTYIRAWMSLKYGQIRELTPELAAIEHQKNPARLIMGETVLPIFFAGHDDIHNEGVRNSARSYQGLQG